MPEVLQNNLVWSTFEGDQLEQVDAVVSFLQGEFGSVSDSPMWTSDFMRWKLGTANPAGSGFLSYAMVNGQVVGSVTLTRKRALLNGIEISCGEVGDTYTSEFMRRKGKPVKPSDLSQDPNHFFNKSIFGRLASEIFSRACSQGVELVYGTPNQNAYPGWTKKLGYTELRTNPVHCFSRPTSYLLGQKVSKLKPLSALLAFAERQWLNASCMIGKLRHSGLTMNQVDPGHTAIDALWNATKPKKGFSLIRDAAYWHYRYDENPLTKYEKFYFWKDAELTGMAVCRKTDQPDGKRVFSLVEWMTFDQSALGAMLSMIIRKAFSSHQPGVFNLWARGHDSFSNQLKYLFFLRRAKVPVIFGPTSLATQLERPDGFCFFIGSSDAM